MAPCVALEASNPVVSVSRDEENMEMDVKEQPGSGGGNAENPDEMGQPDLNDDSLSGPFFEEYWDDDDDDDDGGGDSSYASEDEYYSFHEWYLPEAYCQSYEIPVLFEDGMDLVECELYYAAREQGSGGYKKISSKSNHGNRRTTPTSVASHHLFQRGGGVSSDGRRPLPSCLRETSSRRFASTLSPPLDVPACPPQRVDEDLSALWLNGAPGIRRCSYAGVITAPRKPVPIGSPTPKRHQHGKDWFVNRNPSATPFPTSSSDMDSHLEGHVENPQESLTAASSSSNHSRDSTSSTLSSSTMPPALPKRRSSLLEWHRKSKSQSELLDMVDPSVSFAPVVQVTTIPAAHEYPSDIRRDLWNTRRELKRYLRLAKSERRHRQQQNKGLSDDESEGTDDNATTRRTRRNGKKNNQTKGNQQEQPSNNELDPECQAAEDEDVFCNDNDLQSEEVILDRLDQIR